VENFENHNNKTLLFILFASVVGIIKHKAVPMIFFFN